MANYEDPDQTQCLLRPSVRILRINMVYRKYTSLILCTPICTTSSQTVLLSGRKRLWQKIDKYYYDFGLRVILEMFSLEFYFEMFSWGAVRFQQPKTFNIWFNFVQFCNLPFSEAEPNFNLEVVFLQVFNMYRVFRWMDIIQIITKTRLYSFEPP